MCNSICLDLVVGLLNFKLFVHKILVNWGYQLKCYGDGRVEEM